MRDNKERKPRKNADERAYTRGRPAEERRERRSRARDDGDDRGLIVGRNPVIEALKAEKPIDTLFVNKDAGGSIGMIVRMARDRGIVVKETDDRKLTAMTEGASHQGCVAIGACAEYSTIEDILAVSREKGSMPFIIICDEIEDPHNLGAVIRTAEAAGADGIIIPKRRSASLSFTVNKTSAGAASYVKVARVPNLAAAVAELKKNGIWVFGTDASGEMYTEADLAVPMALVIGSEGNGMGKLMKEKCDYLLKLPMYGKITSLNASVAAGIFMYEVIRQRNSD